MRNASKNKRFPSLAPLTCDMASSSSSVASESLLSTNMPALAFSDSFGSGITDIYEIHENCASVSAAPNETQAPAINAFGCSDTVVENIKQLKGYKLQDAKILLEKLLRLTHLYWGKSLIEFQGWDCINQELLTSNDFLSLVNEVFNIYRLESTPPDSLPLLMLDALEDSDVQSQCSSSNSSPKRKRRKHTRIHYSLKSAQQSNKIINPRNAQIKDTEMFKFDVFFSYPWGNEVDNWPTQQCVKKIVNILREFGLKVWIDIDHRNEMSQGMAKAITDGIDSSALFVCFMTKEYYEKVNIGDTRDYKCLEFMYASERKGNQGIKTVLLDKRIKKTASFKWKGIVQGVLGSQLYLDMSNPMLFFEDNQKAEVKLEAKCKELYDLLIWEDYNSV